MKTLQGGHHSASKLTLGFLGAGNLAASMIQGLLKKGYAPSQLWATRRNKHKLALFLSQGVQTTTSNEEAIFSSDVIILSVKPHQMRDLLVQNREAFQKKKPLLLSLAAGLRCRTLLDWLGFNLPLVRCMPNTPSAVGCSATALYATEEVNASQKHLAKSILDAVGISVWLSKESDIDIATALSGSGPAYVLAMMEALQKAAVALGLDMMTANTLTLQTVLGAAKLALQSNESLASLRQAVTSKGGTTEAGLNVLKAKEFDGLFFQVLQASSRRSNELADQQENSKWQK